MPEPLISESVLDPISAELPAGTDLRWSAEWDQIKEARRSDDPLDQGKWAKKERKVADWRLVQQLATSFLRERSKDLQLALWLAEANIILDGFAGLASGLQTTRELMLRYWDTGLFPTMENGPEDRKGPFEWLNDKLVDSIAAIPITARTDHGSDYALIHLRDAKRTGSEANCRTADGEFDPNKKKAYDQALQDGHISMEMFDRAVKETGLDSYAKLNSEIIQACDEFNALEKAVDEKFGDAAPSLSACRNVLQEIKEAAADILEKLNPAVIVDRNGISTSGSHSADSRAVLSSLAMDEADLSIGAAWREAEALVRTGSVDKGLAEMMRLASREASGRSRFLRKLLLAEVCLATSRQRLGRSILEELAEQIDKFQLDQWESSQLINNVWSRLYRIYKQGSDSSDLDRADQLYQRLCRLDPWQALTCYEA